VIPPDSSIITLKEFKAIRKQPGAYSKTERHYSLPISRFVGTNHKIGFIQRIINELY
jgi:hypothetical protein